MFARALLRVALVAALLACTSANAGLFRAYLSVNGSDVNPCTVAAPCRLLPAALAAVNDGGEIWMLDSANFNTSTVTIAKSVTILAVPGAVGSVVSVGGVDAIDVNGAGIQVTLRNLTITQLAGSTSASGVNFSQGSQLVVEHCEIADLQQKGILVSAPSGTTIVRDTVLRNNAVGFDSFGTNGKVVLERVSAEFNANGVYIAGGGTSAVVTDSVISNGGNGVVATASGATTSYVVLTRTVLSGNTSFGVGVIAASGSAARVTLDASVVANNTYGASFAGGPGTEIIYTRQNNTFQNNSSGDLLGGSLTTLGAM